MKNDIYSKSDIKFIIETFYKKLITDDEMYPFFEKFVKNNQLNHHINIITDFWNDILFDTTLYKNNTMQKHIEVSKKKQFSKDHFHRWTSYFFETIDTHFTGPNTEKMKNRTTSIATVIQLKTDIYNSKKSKS